MEEDKATTAAADHHGPPQPFIRTRSMARLSSIAASGHHHVSSSSSTAMHQRLFDHRGNPDKPSTTTRTMTTTNKPSNGAIRRSSTSTALSLKPGAENALRQPTRDALPKARLSTAEHDPLKPQREQKGLGTAPVHPTTSPSKIVQAGPRRAYEPSAMLRSPSSPVRRTVSLKPKRVSDFGVHADADQRPSKRLFTGDGGSSCTVPHLGQRGGAAGGAAAAIPIKRSTSSLKPRRSTVGLVNPNGRPSLLPPPTSTRPPPPQQRSTTLFKDGQAAPKLNTPSSASASTLAGTSPSKFGLTIPREFTFSQHQSPAGFRNRLEPPTDSLSPAKPLTTSMSGLSLAPSPIREDEHVPKPVFTTAMHESQAPNLLVGQENASLSMPLSRSPAATTSLSALHVQASTSTSTTYTITRPSIFPTSPLQHRQASRAAPSQTPSASPEKSTSSVRRTQLYDAYRSPSRSPVRPSDLMQRTLERPRPMMMMPTSPTTAASVPRLTFDAPPKDTSSDDKRKNAHQAAYASSLADADGEVQPLASSTVQASQDLFKPPPIRVAPVLQSIPPISAEPQSAVVNPIDTQRSKASVSEVPVMTTGFAASPSKRPLSPDSAMASLRDTESSSKVQRSGMTRSASMGGIAQFGGMRRMSTRRSSRQLAMPPQVTPPYTNASVLPKSAAQDTLSQGCHPIPTSPQRAATCPSIELHLSPDDTSAVSNESQGSVSDTTMDIDTSIMSASGHTSLANLQSLLSRMSAPRQSIGSRRSSFAAAGSSSMSLRDERAELEAQDSTTSTNGDPVKRRVTKGVPRYAAPTTSSSARNGPANSARSMPSRPATSISALPPSGSSGLAFTNNDTSTAPSSSVPNRRRVSLGVPTVRKGNLVPLATSSNAGKNTMARSTSELRDMSMDPAEKAGQTTDHSATQANHSGSQIRLEVLKNVVAYVDVKTAEGDEAGGVFVDILRSLGARVLSRPTDSVTHIIYKGGRPTTLHRYRAYREPKPFLVGVGWIVKCREMNERVDEKPFLLNPDHFDAVLLNSGAKSGLKASSAADAPPGGNPAAAARRKSLEPRILIAQPASGLEYAPAAARSVFSNTLQVHPAHTAELDRARRRTLQFAPRIGSPLKQRVFNAFEADEDALEED